MAVLAAASRPKFTSARTRKAPIGAALTPGEAQHLKVYQALMEESAPRPTVLVADRGYDADAVRLDMEQRKVVPVILTTKNRRVPTEIDRAIYTLRNRIERCFNRLKNTRRVATRCDKLAETFHDFVQPTAIRLSTLLCQPCLGCL